MDITTAVIVICTGFVTTIVHLAHTVWTFLPSIITGLRAIGAALSVAAGIRALRSRRQGPE
jgi:hypothetical protein